MNIEQLNYVAEVTKTGSLTQAAQNQHVTLSTISQAISHLEAELGVPLFHRSRAGAVPTAEGKVLLQRIYEILGKVQDLKSEAFHFTSDIKGEIRIASIPGPMALWTSAFIRFKQDYPAVQTMIAEKGSLQILNDIRQDKLDIGLVIESEQLKSKMEGLVFEPLLEGRIVAGVDVNSPYASASSITAEQLKTEMLVIYQDDYVEWFIEEFQKNYGKVHVVFVSNNTDAIRAAVQHHQAITVGVDFTFRASYTNANSRIVTLGLADVKQKPVSLGWVRAESKHFTGPIQSFITRLREELQ
ncbi:LysR family transcriptional regulator [Paenibacillus sp. Marseille-Q4541]|uniref:LysR family transcriptional regulator n=1 Tax=Paenibacillus sp. Marseille-Q4541 TaxID=2831522 RepID=UPI001BAA7706|nr:LysR family transcriptional regulator [Paenibacillus sp. Marseille-Q4541]